MIEVAILFLKVGEDSVVFTRIRATISINLFVFKGDHKTS